MQVERKNNSTISLIYSVECGRSKKNLLAIEFPMWRGIGKMMTDLKTLPDGFIWIHKIEDDSW